ncbi:MAG TPA: hypothetical protein VN688_01650 [Gemmataceae bacterium]|nr:hypothetical protein [Gemmataceae bacterium]
MKTTLSLLSASFVLLLLLGKATALDDKKDSKNPLPGNAEWELKAFNSLFRVLKTDYDAATKQVKWTVETRAGHRTADFLRDIARKPFTFRFLDGDKNELATVQLSKADFQGVPNARVMKEGTRLTITLEVPKAMPRTKKVLLQRGAS